MSRPSGNWGDAGNGGSRDKKPGDLKQLLFVSRRNAFGEEIYLAYYSLRDGRAMVCAKSKKYHLGMCIRFTPTSLVKAISMMEAATFAVGLEALARSGRDPNLGFKEVNGARYVVVRGVAQDECNRVGGTYSDGECAIDERRFLQVAAGTMVGVAAEWHSRFMAKEAARWMGGGAFSPVN